MRMEPSATWVKNMERKNRIRQWALGLREALTGEEVKRKSDRIIAKVLEDFRYVRAEHILVYMDYRNEVMTGSLVSQAWLSGKRVYAPKVMDEAELCFYEINSMEQVEKGYRGIREPVQCEMGRFKGNPDELRQSMLLLPGVAFDGKRHRIGYGKGYYDRFLLGKEGMATVGVCFDCQVMGEFQVESFDYSPQVLYTEKREF